MTNASRLGTLEESNFQASTHSASRAHKDTAFQAEAAWQELPCYLRQRKQQGLETHSSPQLFHSCFCTQSLSTCPLCPGSFPHP